MSFCSFKWKVRHQFLEKFYPQRILKTQNTQSVNCSSFWVLMVNWKKSQVYYVRNCEHGHTRVIPKHHSLHFELSVIWLFKKSGGNFILLKGFHSRTEWKITQKDANFNWKEWKTTRKSVVPHMALQSVLLNLLQLERHPTKHLTYKDVLGPSWPQL